MFICLYVAGTALIILSSLATPKEKFYYSFNKKVPLFEKHNTILVKYSEEIKKVEAEKFFEESSPNVKIKWHTPILVEIDCRSEKIKEELKLKLKSKREIKSILPFYVTKDNVDKGITDEILVRFLPNVKQREKNELHEKFGTKVVKTTKIYQKLVVPKGTDLLETANSYYETGLFEFAYPCFVTNFKPCQIYPNDTYFGNQITCHNTGQTFTDGHSGTNDADIDAPDVWDITTGNNDIVIAVLDQGVTSNHPDLPDSRQVRLAGSDFVSNDNDPSPIGNENHGNACAGVIAATMNTDFHVQVIP
jgi:subtilisin family serine protease